MRNKKRIENLEYEFSTLEHKFNITEEKQGRDAVLFSDSFLKIRQDLKSDEFFRQKEIEKQKEEVKYLFKMVHALEDYLGIELSTQREFFYIVKKESEKKK
jgi:hypothetical protein